MLATTSGLSNDSGFSAWPDLQLVQREYGVVLEPLVKFLGEKSVLTAFDGTVICPASAIYFPTPTAALQELRPLLLSLCTKLSKQVVDPPEHV
eukprot:1279083-Amphidinium_carterae.1